LVPAVAVLRRGGTVRNHWQMGVGRRPTLACHFRVLRLWRHSAQAVVDRQLVGLYPLLPLMNWGPTAPEAALRQCDQQIWEQVEPGEAHVDAWIALRVFARTAFPAELVERVLPRRQQMIESPAFDDFFEEGRAEGEVRGRLQGNREGQRQGQRDAIVVALEARFGPVPVAIVAQVAQLTDLPLLSAQLRRAVMVESLEVFAQGLPALPLVPA
jgi:predicted transposase YdaD